MEVTVTPYLEAVIVCDADDRERVQEKLRSLNWRITSATRNPVPGTGQFDMSKFRFRAQRLASADSERIITAASLQKQLS